jgi:hypothetical protein
MVKPPSVLDLGSRTTSRSMIGPSCEGVGRLRHAVTFASGLSVTAGALIRRYLPRQGCGLDPGRVRRLPICLLTVTAPPWS